MGMRTFRILATGLVALIAMLVGSLPDGCGLSSQPPPIGPEILVEDCDGSLGRVDLARSINLEKAASRIPAPVLVDNNLTALQIELRSSRELVAITVGAAPAIFAEHASATYSLHLVGSERVEKAAAKARSPILVEHASGITTSPLVASADLTEGTMSVLYSILIEHSQSAMLFQLSAPPGKASSRPTHPSPGEHKPGGSPWLWIVLAGVVVAVVIVVLLSRW